ncbi:MAG: DUF3623 family protein, partial [Aestuariivirga sp.]
VLLFLSAAGAYTEHDVTSLSFLGAMMTLALVEHWFLMLPLPVEKLFRWTLAVQHGPRRPAHATASEAVELKLVKTTP